MIPVEELKQVNKMSRLAKAVVVTGLVVVLVLAWLWTRKK